MKRWVIGGVVALLAVGAAAPFTRADSLRGAIQQALERGLGRRVDAGAVHYNLFTGPGFTVSNVTIHDDPAAGIEPFAHMESLEARVDLFALLFGRLEFSSLVMMNTTVNLVKPDQGPWNFQSLLAGQHASAGAVPSVRIRSGRVNLKFGDTKSVFYFRNADLDVSPMAGGVEVRFAGAPSRTDRAAQNFGFLFVRGTLRNNHADFRVELERSAIAEVARLLEGSSVGVHGVVAFDARVQGPVENLRATGQITLDDIHRWDLLPSRGGGWRLPLAGSIDLHGQKIELETPANAGLPVSARLHVANLLGAPQWKAGVDFIELPAATLLEVARHMSAGLPPNIALEGKVGGALAYSSDAGFTGRVSVRNASLALPDGEPVRADLAEVILDAGTISLQPVTVTVGDSQSAEIEGRFRNSAFDLRIASRGVDVSALTTVGLASVPVIESLSRGHWRGWTRFRRVEGGVPEWSGELELSKADFRLAGVADPVRIQSAAVSFSGAKANVRRLRASCGALTFAGDYQYIPGALRPHRFRLTLPEAPAAEIERLLMPTLVRDRGFLVRTFRLNRPAPIPEWLRNRRAEGHIAIGPIAFGSIMAGDSGLRSLNARVMWDGTLVRLHDLEARQDPAMVTGALEVNLAGAAPRYHFRGRVADLPWRGGRIDLEGALNTAGTGLDLAAHAHAEGVLRARAISLPDADFRTATATFECSVIGGAPRWSLTAVEATQEAETYVGTGATQPDGRILLDLMNVRRQTRLSVAALPWPIAQER